jgi:hypothetical protein
MLGEAIGGGNNEGMLILWLVSPVEGDCYSQVMVKLEDARQDLRHADPRAISPSNSISRPIPIPYYNVV